MRAIFKIDFLFAYLMIHQIRIPQREIFNKNLQFLNSPDMIALSMIKYSTAICFTNGIIFFFFFCKNLIIILFLPQLLPFVTAFKSIIYLYNNTRYSSNSQVMSYNPNTIEKKLNYFSLQQIFLFSFRNLDITIFLNKIKYM